MTECQETEGCEYITNWSFFGCLEESTWKSGNKPNFLQGLNELVRTAQDVLTPEENLNVTKILDTAENVIEKAGSFLKESLSKLQKSSSLQGYGRKNVSGLSIL